MAASSARPRMLLCWLPTSCKVLRQDKVNLLFMLRTDYIHLTTDHCT